MAHRGLTGFYSDMETRAGDPGAFARFDLTRVPSPAFVVDAAKVRANLALLRHIGDASGARVLAALRSEEHTSELQSLMRHSYAVFCLKTKHQDTKRTKI